MIQANEFEKLFSLHRHYYTADAIRQFVDAPIQLDWEPPLQSKDQDLARTYSHGLRFVVWYALLYVVIEGYRELGLNDPNIDKLLKQTHMVNALKRFRNAVFHYQQFPISDKLLEFVLTANSKLWIHELDQAFRSYFERFWPMREWFERLDASRAADKK